MNRIVTPSLIVMLGIAAAPAAPAGAQAPARSVPQTGRGPVGVPERASANDPVPETAKKRPPLKVLPDGFIDFGYAQPKAFPTKTLALSNEGQEVLRIKGVKGDCHCVDATLVENKTEFQPGEVFEIIVGLEMPMVLGAVGKQVIVEVEGFEEPIRIPVYADVGWAVRVNGGAQFAIVPDRVGSLTLDSVDGQPFEVKAVQGEPPVFVGYDPSSGERRSQYTVQYDFSALPAAELPRWLIIETDHPEARMIDVPAMIPGGAQILDRFKWSVYEERLLIDHIEPGSSVVTTYTIIGRKFQRTDVINMDTARRDLSLEIVGARPSQTIQGLEVDLKITPSPDFNGFLHSVLSVEIGGESTGFDLYARVGEP